MHSGARPGMCRAYDLSDSGVVLGRLFRNRSVESGDYEDAALTSDKNRAVELGGAYLAVRYWGRYVALTRSADGKLHVARDASGGMPVYFCRLAEADLIFSHLEDCLAIVEHALSINWDHLRAYLSFNRLVTSATGYQEVQQLRAGESAVFDDKTVTRAFHWHPVPFAEAAAKAPEDLAEGKTRLAKAVRHSVHAWASCHRHILHELSGGLDSSIVLACLASAPSAPKTVCFNLYTESPEGDERSLARMVSQRCASELIEVAFRPALGSRLEDLLITSNLVSPQLATIRTESEEARRKLAEERGIDAIYSGQGGDHLFHRRQSPLVAADYVRRHGLRPGCLPLLLDTARMSQQPITSVFATALRFGVLRRRHDPYAGLSPPPFVCTKGTAAERPETGDGFDHPWVCEADHLPAAKRQQIADLVDTQCFFTASCTYSDVVHPIISQPVIECCLRIPTYMLTQGGIERGLARTAFSNDLPREVIERTAKGDATAYYHKLILQNLGAIREWLLDGWLVRERLLNRALTEQALKENALIDGYAEPYILAAMMAEAWVRDAIKTRHSY